MSRIFYCIFFKPDARLLRKALFGFRSGLPPEHPVQIVEGWGGGNCGLRVCGWAK